MGPLYKRFGGYVGFDVGRSMTTKVASIIHNKKWGIRYCLKMKPKAPYLVLATALRTEAALAAMQGGSTGW